MNQLDSLASEIASLLRREIDRGALPPDAQIEATATDGMTHVVAWGAGRLLGTWSVRD